MPARRMLERLAGPALDAGGLIVADQFLDDPWGCHLGGCGSGLEPRRPLAHCRPAPERQFPQLLVVGRVMAGFSEPSLRDGVLPRGEDGVLVGEQLPRGQTLLSPPDAP
jgi:hypothetical protein